MHILSKRAFRTQDMVIELSDPTALGPHFTFKNKGCRQNFQEWEKIRTEIILKLLDPNEVNMVGKAQTTSQQLS